MSKTSGIALPAGRSWGAYELTAAFVVFIAALFLYIVTLAPSYVWGDSTKLLFYVIENRFVGLGGGFGTHPLHNVLGYVFSFLPVPLSYSQNLLSAVAAATAVSLTYCIILEWVGDIRAALAGAVSLAVSHVFWLFAVMNESYSLLSCSLLLAMFLGVKWTSQHRDWQLYALAGVIGAGLANHALLLLSLPGLLALLWGTRFLAFCLSWKIAVAILAFLIGSCQILLLPVLDTGSLFSFAGQVIGDTSDTYRIYSAAAWKLLKELAAYPLYLLYQFPGPAFLLGVIGCVTAFRRSDRLMAASALILLPVLLFAAQYMKQRQFPMMLPTFSMFALWIGYGAFTTFHRFHPLKTGRLYAVLLAMLALFPPLVYYAASRTAEAVRIDVSFIRSLPYRNPYTYYLFPSKYREEGPQRYVADSFAQAKSGAIILADFVPGMVLLYEQRIEGRRPDIELDLFIDDWVHHARDPGSEVLTFIRTHLAEQPARPLYLADDWEAYYHTSEIRKEFELQRTGGPLWEVIPRTSGFSNR